MSNNTLRIYGLFAEKYIGEHGYDRRGKLEYEPEEMIKYHLLMTDPLGYRFDLSLWQVYGPCPSCYTISTYGKLEIKMISNKIIPFTHLPKQKIELKGEIEFNDKTEQYELYIEDKNNKDFRRVDIHDVNEKVENNLFSFVPFDDPWYPEGWVSVNLDLFEEVYRSPKKRPVWIFYGPSGLGKTTIGSFIENKKIFETDSVNDLPDIITEDIIIIGNRSKKDPDDMINNIKERLFGEPEIILVGFSKYL